MRWKAGNGRSGPGNRRANHTENATGRGGVSMLENLAVVLTSPALLPRPVRNQVSLIPDWSTVPLIMADQAVRRRIELLWFRCHKISNPRDLRHRRRS